jgi:uncharacterized protein YecE (DUF72 family)
MPVSENLLVGTRGWLHAEWNEQFYPEELPEDWRFCYYSNLIRSVLIPAELWDEVGSEQVRQWAEDSDPGFRFVHELPSDLSQPLPADALGRRADEFLATLAPVADRTVGLLARLGAVSTTDLDWLSALIDALGERHPLCVDLELSRWPRPAVDELLDERGVGLCWHPGAGTRPAEGGRLLIALMGRADLKRIRAVVEALGVWASPGRAAALFFDDLATAANQARETRILAELLGV